MRRASLLRPLRPSLRRAALGAVVPGAVVALLAACQAVEGPSMRGDAEPTTASRPSSFWRDAVRAQSIEPRVYDNDVPRRLQWLVEAGTSPGGVAGLGRSEERRVGKECR